MQYSALDIIKQANMLKNKFLWPTVGGLVLGSQLLGKGAAKTKAIQNGGVNEFSGGTGQTVEAMQQRKIDADKALNGG